MINESKYIITNHAFIRMRERRIPNPNNINIRPCNKACRDMIKYCGEAWTRVCNETFVYMTPMRSSEGKNRIIYIFDRRIPTEAEPQELKLVTTYELYGLEK